MTPRRPGLILLVPLLSLAAILLPRRCLADVAEVGADGDPVVRRRAPPPRPVRATFVNSLGSSSANLYWAGTAGTPSFRALRMYYGPLGPGGRRTVDAYEGMAFAFTDVGGYGRLGEFVLEAGRETYVLTEEMAGEFRGGFPPRESGGSEAREARSRECRALVAADAESDESEACRTCASAPGCGYSQARGACFVSHPTATVDTVEECDELSGAGDLNSRTVDGWLFRAKALQLFGEGSKAQRLAYRCLQRALERATLRAGGKDTRDNSWSSRAVAGVRASLEEQRAKIEGVFDDADHADLLGRSRHPKLAEVHPDMPAVPRLTAEEAREYIVRGEPVVVTDAFDGGDGGSPIPQTWTLEYLRERVFDDGSVSFNVAADEAGRCCRYFDPQARSAGAGYPYPFEPTTRLIRDTFGGFVDAVRGAERDAIPGGGGGEEEERLLYYLHEIVMNRDGDAAVAGGSAPSRLRDDLAATTPSLLPLASSQPFFGSLSYAKVWIGQGGVVMPVHYDATDNLYVMAWGRKRAIIGEPGQLGEMYRYPNGHPLVGSSQVNLTDPDLGAYPEFAKARLREVVVGPGDVLFLPAYWWHQFEQPFEGTAAVNFWSVDSDNGPYRHMAHTQLREHQLADALEDSVVRLLGNRAGLVLDALSKGEGSAFSRDVSEDDADGARRALVAAARKWQAEASDLPGGHPLVEADPLKLVEDYLDRTHRAVDMDAEGWKPGTKWSLDRATPLPKRLRERCREAGERSPFMSLCD